MYYTLVGGWTSVNQSVFIDSSGEYRSALPNSQHKFVDLSRLGLASKKVIRDIAQKSKDSY